MNLIEKEDSLSSLEGFLETDIGEINLSTMDVWDIVPTYDQDDEYSTLR